MRRQQEARETYAAVFGGALIVIALVAVLFGGNYRTLTEAIDTHTTDFNSGVLNILANTGENVQTSPCYIPDKPIPMAISSQSSAPTYAPPPDGDDNYGYLQYNRGKRVSSCMLYRMLLFDPWANGQYGTSDPLLVDDFKYNTDQIKDPDGYCVESPYRCKASDRPPGSKINIAIQQVVAQGFTRNETISYASHRELFPPTTSPYRLQLWKTVQYSVAHRYPQYYATWKGAEPTGRMATAIGSAVMNLIVLIVVGFIAVLTIFWHGVLFVGWVLLPVAAAVAIFPPARRILRAIVGIMVQAVFLRCVFGLVLVVLLGIMNAIQVADGSTALKIILMIIAALAIWKILSALRSGALSPQIAQEAAQAGVLPSDQGVDRGFQAGRAVAAGLTVAAARRQYGRWAGGRAGAAVARENSPHHPDSREYYRDVRDGRQLGRVQGGRAATSLGRTRLAAETNAISRVDRNLEPARRRLKAEDEQTRAAQAAEDRQKKAAAEEARRARQQETEERRHREIIEGLEGKGKNK